MTEAVFPLAMALSRVEDGEAEELRALCALAEETLRRRLRPGVAAEDCGQAFPAGAAWLALSWLGAGDPSTEVTAFAAGDFSLRREGGGGARAEGLRRLSARILAPYLEDGGFFFRGVPG